ncbi:alpha/beta hydrolase [Microbacterium sp. Mu-80]|uniref:Alpha/beta hydrolase n=1 Tax=Microbacterium bandirmense TaxID=3122050 RepID=A0ABU8L908_9MICO
MSETARMLALLNETFPDLTRMAPEDARRAADARIRPAAADKAVNAEDVTVDAGTHRLEVRVYRPHVTAPDAPVTVYAHGGGFLHGSIIGHDGFCRRWAQSTGGTVVSVEYRVSTQAPPPAARDDLVTAVRWAQQAALADNGVILAGDSSGGNLAAGAAIVLRDLGETPVVGQALLYPFLDPTMSTESHRTRATGYFVTDALLSYYWQVYVGAGREPADAAADADVTPLAIADLTGLPPAVVVTAGLDPLCDEGIQYASRLRAAGVPVVERHYPGQFHGFLTIPDYGPASSASEVLWADLRHLSHTLTKESR